MGTASRRPRLAALFLAAAFSCQGVLADPQTSFVWGFNTFTATALPECAQLQLFVGTTGGAVTTAAKPPFFLIAYEAGGLATVQSTGGSNLSQQFWTVDHKPNTQLILSMVDAAGNSGGVAQQLYTVTTGTGSSCHPTNPTSPITLTANATSSLNSCDALMLKISGGQKPYSVTIAASGSTTVTNVTMGSQFDSYEWINRAAPNSQLIATAIDANGAYSPATALITTAGSTDLTCGGRESSEIDSTGQASAVQSGTAAVTATGQPNQTSNNKSSNGSSLGTIIGAAVGGAVLIGALVAGALFFLRRRRKSRTGGPQPFLGDDAYAGFGLGKVGTGTGQGVAYMGVPPHAEEITPFVATNGQPGPYRDYSPYNSNTYSSSAPSEATSGPSMYNQQPPTHVSPGPSAQFPPRHLPPGAASPPPSTAFYDPYNAYPESSAGAGSSSGPSNYSASAAQPPVAGGSGSGSGSGSASGLVAGASASRSGFAVANPGVGDDAQDVKGGVPPPEPRTSVYQHEDINDVVELPPAYKERNAL